MSGNEHEILAEASRAPCGLELLRRMMRGERQQLSPQPPRPPLPRRFPEVGAVRCIATAIQLGIRIAAAEPRIVDRHDEIHAHGAATGMAAETHGA